MSKWGKKSRLDYFNTDKLPLDEDARILFIDVETAGLDAETDDLLQIGWVTTDEEDFGNGFYVSGATVKEEAQRINGITQETIDNEGKLPAEIWPKLKEALDWCNVVAFYNAGFDAGFIGRLFGDDWYSACMNKRLLDVLDVARKPWCWGAWPGDYKLQTMAKLIGLGPDKSDLRAHDALGDALLTYNVWHEFPWAARKYALHGEVLVDAIGYPRDPGYWRLALEMAAERELLKIAAAEHGDFTTGPWEVTVTKGKRTTTQIPEYFQVPDDWKKTSEYNRVNVKLKEV